MHFTFKVLVLKVILFEEIIRLVYQQWIIHMKSLHLVLIFLFILLLGGRVEINDLIIVFSIFVYFIKMHNFEVKLNSKKGLH